MPVINSLSQARYIKEIIRDQNQRLDTLQRQQGSGLKADRYGGLSATEARLSLRIRGEQERIEGYRNSIALAQGRSQAIEEALNGVNKAMIEVRDTIQSLFVEDLDGSEIRVTARQKFAQIVDRLNVRYDGISLFSGRAAPPSPPTGLFPILAPDTILAGVQTAVNAGSPFATANAAFTAVNGYIGTNNGDGLQNWFSPGDALVDDGGGTAYEAGAPGAALRISDTRTIQVSLSAIPRSSFTVATIGYAGATTDAIRDTMRVVAAVSTVTLNDFGGDRQLYGAFLNDAITSLNRYSRDINNMVAVNGTIRKELDIQVKAYEDTDVRLKEQLSYAEEVDPTEVISELQSRRNQLEMTYKITADLRQLSLFRYL